MLKRYFIYFSTSLICLFFSNLHAQKNKSKNKITETPSTNSGQVSWTPQEKTSYELYGNATTKKAVQNYEGALKDYENVLALMPNNSGALYEAGGIYLALRKPSEALPLLEKAVKLDPTNKWYLKRLGETYLTLKENKKAIEVYKNHVQLEKSNTDSYYVLANLYIKENKLNDALKIYNQLEAKNGVQAEVIEQKSKIYLSIGKTSLAEKEIQKLIDSDPSEPYYYGLMAEFYFEINKKEQAFKMYQKVLEKDPQNPIIHLALADYYQKADEPKKVFENLALAFKNPNVNVNDKVKILISYYDQSNNNKNIEPDAFKLLEILEAVHPNDARTYSIKGDFYNRDAFRPNAKLGIINPLDTALAAYSKSLAIDETRKPIWNQVIKIYSQKNNSNKVDSLSQKAIEVFPEFPDFYYYAAIANQNLKNYAATAKLAENGIQFATNDAMLADFYSILAESYHHLENNEKSDAYFDKALKIASNSGRLMNNFAYYLSERNEQLEKAKELSSKAVKLAPKNAIYLDTYAWVLFKLGIYDEALSVIENAIANGGDKMDEVQEHYAEILYKNNRQEEAKLIWKKLIDKGYQKEKLELKLK